MCRRVLIIPKNIIVLTPLQKFNLILLLEKIYVKFNTFHVSQAVHSNFNVNLTQEHVRK